MSKDYTEYLDKYRLDFNNSGEPCLVPQAGTIYLVNTANGQRWGEFAQKIRQMGDVLRPPRDLNTGDEDGLWERNESWYYRKRWSLTTSGMYETWLKRIGMWDEYPTTPKVEI